MYKVLVAGENAGYSDTVVYIKLAGNGSYVPCDRTEAEGICVKLPTEYTTEDDEVMQTIVDTVFALSAGGLNGTEEVAELEETTGSLIINEMATVLSAAEQALIEGVESVG